METIEFTPRLGDVLVVLIIVRISTLHQDRKSLDDQTEKSKQYILSRYRGEVRFTVIQGQGSGEILDRTDFLQALEAAESGQYDVIITEDLGRICRRTQATIFCETCEDSHTRLIAINDSIDTSREDWRLGAFFASIKHEMANRDTSLRIRRSLRNRFQQGGIVQCTVFGYIKPPGTISDDQLEKDPAAQPIYDEIFRRLEDGASYWEVSDWLNEQGVPVGPYIRAKRWDGRIVARLVHNPILKGVRRRNDRVSVRVNKTGRRKTIKAPRSERLERICPHLAFIEPERYDRLIALSQEPQRWLGTSQCPGHRLSRRSRQEAYEVAGTTRPVRCLWPPLLLGRPWCGVTHDVRRRPGVPLLERGYVRRS